MNYKIDKFGNPYVEGESFPCGGGLDKRCTYNEVALYCYYILEDKVSIYEFLKKKGWDNPIHSDNSIEIWENGDTKIYFEDYSGKQWGYLYTEYVGAEGNEDYAKRKQTLLDAIGDAIKNSGRVFSFSEESNKVFFPIYCGEPREERICDAYIDEWNGDPTISTYYKDEDGETCIEYTKIADFSNEEIETIMGLLGIKVPSLNPKKVKRVFRFHAHTWTDVIVEVDEDMDDDEVFELANDKYNNGEYDYDSADGNFENTDCEEITDMYINDGLIKND